MATLWGSEESPIIEALIDGTWTDISSRVRNAQKVNITRGRSNEQSRAAAQRASLTLDNADAFFSTRVPTSTNYRKIGKNTQIRVRAGRGDNHLFTPYNDLTDLVGASTTDKASLDITGDIDIRMMIWPHTWRPRRSMTLAAKYEPTLDQRSWIFRLDDSGALVLSWSSAGTSATLLSAFSSVITPPAGPLAVRVTLDVNNGAGGRVVTFYTSDSISGTWTVLGSASTTAGTTSIYSGTAALTLARANSSQSPFADNSGFGGKLYAFELRNGIGGTLVADFDAGDREIGDTSWSDGLASANTWTVAGQGARITSDRVRFWGELSSLPKRWDVTGTDVTIPAQAAGMLRRLTQGAKPIESAMTRNFRRIRSFAWWPLEDGQDTTLPANLAPGEDPGAKIYSGKAIDADFQTTDTPPGAKSALAFNSTSSRFVGKVEITEIPALYNFVFYVRLDALPATRKTFAIINAFGDISRIEISISSASWFVEFFDITGVSITSSTTTVTLINPANGWVGYNLLVENVGANVEYSQRWDTIGTFGGGTGPTTMAGRFMPPPTQVYFTAANDAVFADMKLSQVLVSDQDIDLSNETFRSASNAYSGETAAARIKRLSDEESVQCEIIGFTAESEPMGFQGLKTYGDLISECWETDGGIGGDARDALTQQFRVRSDMESRDDLTLSHPLHDLPSPPEPTDDDQGFTNDVTLTRQGGGSWRAIVTEGYTSISEPPDGVGRTATEATLSMAGDDRLPSVAGWLALAGSWDQDRYPLIPLALHRERVLDDDDLFAGMMGLNLGDTATLTDLPSWMPPDDVPAVVQGYTEQLSRFLWEIDTSTSPGGPYQAAGAVLGSDIRVPRLDATSHTTGGSLTTTATSVSLVTPAGSARWVDSATYPSDFPMDIVIGGEVMTLTAVTGTASPQTGTVTRSVNGVVKSHASGELVRLAEPFYVGR